MFLMFALRKAAAAVVMVVWRGQDPSKCREQCLFSQHGLLISCMPIFTKAELEPRTNRVHVRGAPICAFEQDVYGNN